MQGIYSHGKIQKVYNGIFNAIQEIAQLIRYMPAKEVSSQNPFNQKQLDLDLATDSIIYQSLKNTEIVYSALSQQRPYPTILNENGQFTVTFDPLNGSSIIKTNFAVGSIFGIWPKSNLIGQSCRTMVGACLAIYGPRLSAVIYNQNTNKIQEMLYKKFGETKKKWVCTHSDLKIKPDGEIFAPGNLRIVNIHKGYKKCLDWFIQKTKRLRYSGGLAPDVYQIFVKGQGIFLYPGKHPHIAKLRLLYECAPMSFLAQTANGLCTDGTTKKIMDYTIQSYDQRCEMVLGSKNDVQKVSQMLMTDKDEKQQQKK